jgi:hypothetical protein
MNRSATPWPAAALLLFLIAMPITAAPALSRGTIARLSEDWIICDTREAAQRLGIYLKSGDQFGMDSIISHGLGVNVAQGTGVKIMNAAAGWFEVQVVDGIHSGYLGWVSGYFLVPGK